MTWPKMLALSLVLVACTEQLVEAITGRGDLVFDCNSDAAASQLDAIIRTRR